MVRAPADHGVTTINLRDWPAALRTEATVQSFPLLVGLKLSVCPHGDTESFRPASIGLIPRKPALPQCLHPAAFRMVVVGSLTALRAEGHGATFTIETESTLVWRKYHHIAAFWSWTSHDVLLTFGQRVDRSSKTRASKCLYAVLWHNEKLEVVLIQFVLAPYLRTTRKRDGIHVVSHAFRTKAMLVGASPANTFLDVETHHASPSRKGSRQRPLGNVSSIKPRDDFSNEF